jgi:dienelactone hydrolase
MDPAPAGVIVAHELFGVNPDIRGVADDLARAGFLTIAPEFYHRDAAPVTGWSVITPGGRRASATCTGCGATRRWPTSRRAWSG